MKKYIFLFFGFLSLGLGIAGILLPVLPTTPFLLLAAALFIRSSERLYKWLLDNRLLGARIRRFTDRGGMTRKEKGSAIVMMWAMIGLSLFFTGFNSIILALGVAGTAVMGLLVKTAPEG